MLACGWQKPKFQRQNKMAIFHLSLKAVSRSAGRSSTAAAAYRAGELVVDERTGEIHDYTRKGGVEVAELVLPAGADWTPTRSELWNAAELAERRKDACVAREHEVALPAELDAAQRLKLVRDYAQDLAVRHRCAVDFAIHAPGRGGDNRNHHAHILCTTRKVEGVGLGGKCEREKAGRSRRDDLASERWVWEQICNAALRQAGHAERIDRRSHAERGIEAEPTQHLGPSATGFERRTGMASRRRSDFDQVALEVLARAKLAGDLERQAQQIERAIVDAENDLRAALAERERQALQVQLGKSPMPEPARCVPALILPEGVVSAPAKAGGRYAGMIVAVSDVEAAQDLGRQSVVVHQLVDLDRRPEVGQSIRVQYDQERKGRVEVRATPSKGRSR